MNILAIDQGTSATRALVVGGTAAAVRSVVECPAHPTSPGDGAVEQDPAELLASVVAAGRFAIARAGVVAHGIGLANQDDMVLAWDPDTGRPFATAVSWQDRRAVSVTGDLAEHRADLAEHRVDLEEITGLPLDPYFSAPQLAWLRCHRTAEGVVATMDS
jgi:glycerol kinase